MRKILCLAVRIDLKQFNELLFNLNFDLRERSADQTVLQQKFPSIYTSKPSRMLIDFVNTEYEWTSWTKMHPLFSSLFRAIINLLIIGNAVCLAASYNDLEWFFLSAFVIEALLKMYANGAREYFHHRWNLFDFAIVFVSTVYSLLSAVVKTRKSPRQRSIILENRFVSSQSQSRCPGYYSSHPSPSTGQTRGQYRTVKTRREDSMSWEFSSDSKWSLERFPKWSRRWWPTCAWCL